MKKRLLLGLACTLMIGVSGCMEEKVNLNLNGNAVFSEDFDSEINKKEQELITELITDVNSKYNETFRAYHFIPSKKGFNTDASKNYIFAKNDDGLKIYISKKNISESIYIENYKSVTLGKIVEKEFEEKLNFEGDISILLALKSLEFEGDNVVDILDNTYDTTVFLHVPFELNEENIAMIYEYYEEITSYKSDHFHFLIASGEKNDNTLEYMDQYVYYQYHTRWEEFDKQIKQGLFLDTLKHVSFEKFKSYLTEVNVNE